MQRGALLAVAGLTAISAPARAAIIVEKAAESRLPDILPTDRDAINELLSRLTGTETASHSNAMSAS
jgi:hypothetical protein